jgi:hypothetical protein
MEKINAYVLKNDKSIFTLLANHDRSLRWISDKQIAQRKENGTLEEFMDTFIDKHLWYLPIPRFGRQIEVEACREKIINGAVIALDTICDDKMSYVYNGQDPLVIVDTMYRIGWPHIAFLRRQGKRLLSSQAYVLCLTALNPRDLALVKKETIESQEFNLIARDIIQEETGSFLDSPEDFLMAVSNFLDEKAYNTILMSCPKAGPHWHDVNDLIEQNLLTDDILTSINDFKDNWSRKGIRGEHLQIKISSLLDETPELGI